MKEGIIGATAVVNDLTLMSAVSRGDVLDYINHDLTRSIARELTDNPGCLTITEEKDHMGCGTLFTAQFAVMSPDRYRSLCRTETALSAAHADHQATEVARWKAEAELQLLKAELKELSQ